MFLNSGSLIHARNTFPVFAYALIAGVVICGIVVIWLQARSHAKYKKSDAYLEKQRTRPTTKADAKKMAEKYHLNSTEEELLFNICRINNVPNILFSISNDEILQSTLRNTYNIFKEKNYSPEKFNEFFKLHYRLEMILAQTKLISSTHQFNTGTTIFYVTSTGEMYPLIIAENVSDYFSLEMPKALMDIRVKPDVLQKLNLIVKNKNSPTYYFTSRVIRYNETPSGKLHMILSHSETLTAQSQRQSKREFLDEKCKFCSATANPATEGNKITYSESPNIYDGLLSNISGGGCCIKTKLPIKEGQTLAVKLDSLGINETIIGIIRSTRKLSNLQTFALHIQFIDLPVHIQNKIFAYVYKYEI